LREAISPPAEKGRLVTWASVIALLGNGGLACLKLFSGADSLAVLGDGIDSAIDVLIAIISLAVGRIIARPADRGHPWGHGRAETVATGLLSLLLFFAGGQLVLSAVKGLLGQAPLQIPGRRAVIVSIVSICGKLLLALSQYLLGRRAGSSMLLANARNMASDVGISLAVLAGVGAASLTGIAALDPACAILVGLWVLKSAAAIIIEVNTELMDGSSKGPYDKVFEAVHSIPGAGNPHRARMRRVAGFWDIDLDIEVEPSLTVREAHRIATDVEEAIKARIEGVYDIMVHVEPSGDQAAEEGFGVRESKA
jgi:cation diffusion facilitator family transporter